MSTIMHNKRIWSKTPSIRELLWNLITSNVSHLHADVRPNILKSESVLIKAAKGRIEKKNMAAVRNLQKRRPDHTSQRVEEKVIHLSTSCSFMFFEMSASNYALRRDSVRCDSSKVKSTIPHSC